MPDRSTGHGVDHSTEIFVLGLRYQLPGELVLERKPIDIFDQVHVVKMALRPSHHDLFLAPTAPEKRRPPPHCSGGWEDDPQRPSRSTVFFMNGSS